MMIRSKRIVESSGLSWVEIDLSAVRHNFQEICRFLNVHSGKKQSLKVEVLSVVKADAYGHGMIEIARAIEEVGGRFFAVSSLEEGVTLRRAGNKHRTLVLEAVLPEQALGLVRNNLTPALCSRELACAIDRLARRAKKRFPVHVKIDTGMGRLGVCQKEAHDFMRWLSSLSFLQVEGVLTHFPLADTDSRFTRHQLRVFEAFARDCVADGIPLRYFHAANSMGLGGYPNDFCNLVRPGLMLYGLYPTPSLKKKIKLKPVMTVKARILLIKQIHRGDGVSYGHAYRAVQSVRTAILSIGYSDGYLRSMSNQSQVLVNGVLCAVLGRVTMDQIVVDISQAGGVCAGDEAVILGCQGRQSISADDLASWAGTISYEIVCNLGNRLPRVYKS